jgi:predicted transposase YbfD/YdcC
VEEGRAEPGIAAYFAELEDPRWYNSRHRLLDILVIAICAAVCGADGWEDVELYGETRQEWLKSILELPHGIPSHDTFRRVFAAVDAEEFEGCFMRWIRSVEGLTGGQVVAVDGKTLRRSHDHGVGQSALHMVSAWAAGNRLVLGQRKVDGKSNEITVVPELLDLLELRGCIVTMDAMHCQTETVKCILEKKADYVLPVKENQPKLLETLQGLFDDPKEMHWVTCDHHRTVDEGHGRQEIRECWSTSDPEYLQYLTTLADWQGVRSIAMVQAHREQAGQTTVTRRYFISSLKSDAKLLLQAVRTHWEIENKVHWVLDIAFREDDCRIRQGNGAENFAVLRHIALNLLRREASTSRSLRSKRKRAAWDHDYLLQVLNG